MVGAKKTLDKTFKAKRSVQMGTGNDRHIGHSAMVEVSVVQKSDKLSFDREPKAFLICYEQDLNQGETFNVEEIEAFSMLDSKTLAFKNPPKYNMTPFEARTFGATHVAERRLIQVGYHTFIRFKSEAEFYKVWDYLYNRKAKDAKLFDARNPAHLQDVRYPTDLLPLGKDYQALGQKRDQLFAFFSSADHLIPPTDSNQYQRLESCVKDCNKAVGEWITLDPRLVNEFNEFSLVIDQDSKRLAGALVPGSRRTTRELLERLNNLVEAYINKLKDLDV